MAPPLLEVQGLRKDYGPIRVLKGIDMRIGAGDAHVVIGPNGAGKTTLFKVLSGELPASSGTIRLDGADVTRLAGWQRTRLGVGRTFQVARVFKELTAAENLVVALEAQARPAAGPFALWRLAPSAAIRRAALRQLEEFQLGAVADRAAGSLSHGDKKCLELAMACAVRPRLLMLDEPTAGMASADRRRCVDLIARMLRSGGVSLLLTEHDMDVVFSLATQVTVLNYGEVIASGSPDEVRADPRVREVYLGHDVSAA